MSSLLFMALLPPKKEISRVPGIYECKSVVRPFEDYGNPSFTTEMLAQKNSSGLSSKSIWPIISDLAPMIKKKKM